MENCIKSELCVYIMYMCVFVFDLYMWFLSCVLGYRSWKIKYRVEVCGG